MSERVNTKRLRHLLKRHFDEGGADCDCRECQEHRDLLDARQRIGEQADELLTRAGEVIGVRRELDGARSVLEAAREQAVAGEDLDAEGGEEGQHIRYRKLCKTTERAIRAYDAARAAGGGEDE